MDICKAPTLRLKALNKHSITHIMYIEMEMLSVMKMYIRKRKKLTHNVDSCGYTALGDDVPTVWRREGKQPLSIAVDVPTLYQLSYPAPRR